MLLAKRDVGQPSEGGATYEVVRYVGAVEYSQITFTLSQLEMHVLLKINGVRGRSTQIFLLMSSSLLHAASASIDLDC